MYQIVNRKNAQSEQILRRSGRHRTGKNLSLILSNQKPIAYHL